MKKILLLFIILSFITKSFAQEKEAVFIIGPGRCGSSCLTGVLQIMGLELGNNLKAATVNNVKGKFEDADTISFHQKIFCPNLHFNNPSIVDWDKEPNKGYYVEETKKHLGAHFGNYPIFGIKNPEIALRLPIYLQAVRELGYMPKVILIMRKPEEIAGSLKKVFGYSLERSYLHVSIYLTACLWAFNSCDTISIFFDDLLFETEETVKKIQTFLPFLNIDQQIMKSIGSFIDVSLKHF